MTDFYGETLINFVLKARQNQIHLLLLYTVNKNLIKASANDQRKEIRPLIFG